MSSDLLPGARVGARAGVGVNGAEPEELRKEDPFAVQM